MGEKYIIEAILNSIRDAQKLVKPLFIYIVIQMDAHRPYVELTGRV